MTYPESAGRGRGRPRRDPAQRATVAGAGQGGRHGAVPDDGRGQGGRLRARDLSVAGPPARRRGVARGVHGSTRRWRCAGQGTPGGCSAGWRRPGRTTGAGGSGIDVTAYSVAELEEIGAAARQPERARACRSRSTPGCPGAAPRATSGRGWWRPRASRAGGRMRVTGSGRTSRARDEPEHPSNDRAGEGVHEALTVVDAAGLEPEVRHLSNSAGAMLRPGGRHDLVRLRDRLLRAVPAPDVGSSDDLGLVPAMTVRGCVVLTKRAGCRRERLLRPHLDDERDDHGWRSCPWGTATACRGMRPRRPRC